MNRRLPASLRTPRYVPPTGGQRSPAAGPLAPRGVSEPSSSQVANQHREEI